MTDSTAQALRFVFCVCQIGMERIAKQEILRLHPYLAFAFSRPGFLTFKVQPGTELPDTFELKTTFARTSGWSLGKIDATEFESGVRQVQELRLAMQATCVHVWERDKAIPGDGGFEPGVSPLATQVVTALSSVMASAEPSKPPRVNGLADHAELVFDLVIVEPNSWWFGWHKAFSVPRRWPGGVPLLDLSKPVVSRAYWKMAEALAWSRLPIAAGQTCIELGAAPGGACQLLLEQGMRVIAVDPAALDERIASHPNLTHLRNRTRDVRRSRLKGARWLFADLNVAPAYTLDAVSDLVGQPNAVVEGMLLTIKMMSDELAAEIPDIIERVKKLGFESVHVRQLAFNRREVCLMARQ